MDLSNCHDLNAISVRDLYFSYGKTQILNDYNSNISYGQIYSLLGPSGGGKTTLLKLMLGRLKLQSGSIRVLGKPAGKQNHFISFMPQELGLCADFSINQTLKYFKLIYRISNEDFYERRKILIKLVNLPEGCRLVSQLSGGTQRRLSIAVSLINNPQMVILDEPTVGIDAILRNQIWDYLVERAAQGMTIIIVTHYIEEAANSHRVGLMRNGRLLAEDNPHSLMKMFQEPNLEGVFLKLCCLDDRTNQYDMTPPQRRVVDVNHSMNEVVRPAFVYAQRPASHQSSSTIEKPSFAQYIRQQKIFQAQKKTKAEEFKLKLIIVLTLIYKNIVRFCNSIFSLIILLLPATQALIYCLAVSSDNIKLKAAIVNDDSRTGGLYGEQYIQQIGAQRRHSIEPLYYKNLADAIQAVKNGTAMGAIHFPEAYSEFVDLRIEEMFTADNETVENSTLKLYMDQSMYQRSVEFVNILLESFQNFTQQKYKGQDPELIQLPFDVEMAGKSKEFNFADYYLPSYLLMFVYISQITVSALTLNQEQKSGLFERSLIAGVSHELVFLSHVITGFLIAFFQILLMDLTTFVIFNNPLNGRILVQFALFMLQSMSAMSLGFVISVLINNEIGSIVLVWFTTIPQFFTSGVFWPIEAVNQPIQRLLYMLPLTLPISTVRQVVLQGWDLSNQQVQHGFIYTTIPMFIFFYIALLVFKQK